jgi:hypothetical protein
VIERTKTIIEEARAAKKPKIELCELGFAGAASRAAAAAAAMAAAAAKCAVKRVAVLDQDFVSKGAHVNMVSGSEVIISVDKDGNLIGLPWRSKNNTWPSNKEIQEAVNHLMTNRSSRTELLKTSRAALDNIRLKVPGYNPSDPKMVERLKMVCFRLQKLGTDA